MKTWRLILVLAPLLLLQSCYEAYIVEVPNRVNTPALEKAGDVTCNASGKLQSAGNGHSPFSFSADAAYAPVNHLGVITSLRMVNDKYISHTVTDFFVGSYEQKFVLNGASWDAGAGTFATFAETGKFEAYAGYGMGYMYNSATVTDPGYYRFNFRRYFLQSQVGFGDEESIVLLGIRGQYKQFYSFKGAKKFDDLDLFMMQPFVGVEVGGKLIKFSAQTGMSFGVDVIPDFPYKSSLFYLTLGATLYLHTGHAEVKKDEHKLHEKHRRKYTTEPD